MKLALIGWPVKHSLSPKLYQEILGDKLECYDLLPFESESMIPSLSELSTKYDGINITSPYKRHFIDQVELNSPIVRSINAINTLAFTPDGVLGTNTDVIAVEEILKNYLQKFSVINLVILGSGVMAKVTNLVAEKLNIPVRNLSRAHDGDISHIDLGPLRKQDLQNIIVNCCSRDFIFQGKLSKEDVFWDHNYSFSPHLSTIPELVKSYDDGQGMLKRQAIAAVKFWSETNPKLKC